jgi:hypothetical protein
MNQGRFDFSLEATYQPGISPNRIEDDLERLIGVYRVLIARLPIERAGLGS